MGCLGTRGDSRGYPPWVHLVLPGPGGLARVCDWWRLEDKQGNTTVRGQLPEFYTVRMDCRGLVDPKNKPFGRVLPLEVQIKIMFWVECFYTMDKRKKVVREFKSLPKCDLTGFPQHLGEGRWWNQVVVRLHALRKNGCHHCHRFMDHRLSVSKKMWFDSSSSSHDLDVENFFLGFRLA